MEMATCECERIYPCYVTRGDGYPLMCVKAIIHIWLLMLKMDNWRDRVRILNGDKKDLFKKIQNKKGLGCHEGLTSSGSVFKRRSPL